MTNPNRIIEITGDLLASDCDVILHQANCQSVMGAGIAKQIKQYHPAAFAVDRECKLTPDERFGHYTATEIDTGDKYVEVVNLYGQKYLGRGRHIGDKPADRLAALESAIRAYLTDKTKTTQIQDYNFGVPTYIGCGLAGGDWSKTRAMLERVATDFDIVIHTYTFKP